MRYFKAKERTPHILDELDKQMSRFHKTGDLDINAFAKTCIALLDYWASATKTTAKAEHPQAPARWIYKLAPNQKSNSHIGKVIQMLKLAADPTVISSPEKLAQSKMQLLEQGRALMASSITFEMTTNPMLTGIRAQSPINKSVNLSSPQAPFFMVQSNPLYAHASAGYGAPSIK